MTFEQSWAFLAREAHRIALLKYYYSIVVLYSVVLVLLNYGVV